MKLVSDQSDDDVQYNSARECAEADLRIMASNLLRILAGAGKPEALFEQMFAAVQSCAAMERLRSTSHHFYAQAVDASPHLTRGLKSDGSPIDPAAMARWHAAGTIAVEDAEWDVQRMAMRVVASELHGPTHLRSNAEGAFHDALRAWWDAWEMRRRRGG